MKGFYGGAHKLLAPLARLIFNIKVEGLENEPTAEQGAYCTPLRDRRWRGQRFRQR